MISVLGRSVAIPGEPLPLLLLRWETAAATAAKWGREEASERLKGGRAERKIRFGIDRERKSDVVEMKKSEGGGEEVTGMEEKDSSKSSGKREKEYEGCRGREEKVKLRE